MINKVSLNKSLVSDLNDNLAQAIMSGSTNADAEAYISGLIEGHIYIIAFLSNNPDYFGVYIAVKVDALNIMLIPLKIATNISVTIGENKIVIVSTGYNIPCIWVDITKFKG